MAARDGQSKSGAHDARYAFGGYYRSPRFELIPHVPHDARRVLDVGCAAGEFGRALKTLYPVEVVGIEMDAQASEMARHVLDRVVVGNVEEIELPFPDDYFDCITCADVLEHLVDPWAALRKLKRVLVPGGAFVVSLPNVGFYEIVHGLIEGFWTYTDHGILDRTHLRFFSAVEAQRLVESSELELATLEPLSGVSEEQLPRDNEGYIHLPHARLGPINDRLYRALRTFQMLLIARKPPRNPLAAAADALDRSDFARAYRLAELANEDNPIDRRTIMDQAAGRLGILNLPEPVYRAVLEHQPDHADAWADLAIALIASNRLPEAKPCVQKARSLDSTNARAVGATGLAALALRQQETGFELVKEAVARGADHPALRVALMEAAASLNRQREAAEVLDRAGARCSNHVAVLSRYARFLCHMGDMDGATQCAERALDLAPDWEEAQRVLAEIRGGSA